MKTIVPYTKEIKFNTKIAEIISMSLEHELNVKEDAILGDFIISGEYKTHEISVNKDKFFYRLPFSVDVTESILRDSVAFEIEDFSYEVKDENTLEVNIEFSVSADEIKEELEYEDIVIPEIEETPTRELIVPEEEAVINEEIIKPESIINKLQMDNETYITYHIHIITELDSLESIASFYQVTPELIKEYNNDIEFNIGNKVLIPTFDNE